MSGFYKYESEQLLFGTTVLNLDYTLTVENRDDHTYPVDGWYWFESASLAREYFGIPGPELVEDEAQ